MSAARLAHALGGATRTRGGYMARCPAHHDRDPSLHLTDARTGRVLVHCFAGCAQAAVIDALKAHGLWTNHEDRGREEGVDTSAPPGPERPAHEALADPWRRLWRACRTITSEDPAGRYLAARGCALPHPDGDLRWHPALKHPSGYVGLGLIGLASDIHDAGRWLTVHRTWVCPDGRKADAEPPRLLLKGHPKTGACNPALAG